MRRPPYRSDIGRGIDPLEGSGGTADNRVMWRLKQEEGFGLIELLMAMVMLNIGILAMVAAFNSGIVALARSSHMSTAAVLADQQMELYRGLTYSCIYLSAAGATNNWVNDTTYAQGTTNTTPQP